MRRPIFAILAAVALIAATVGAAAAMGQGKAPPFASIGIHNVYNIGNQYDLTDGGDPPILRVFMETRSSSEACLVTLGEANHAPTVDGLYCSSRHPSGHGWGVMVTLFPAGILENVGEDPAWYSMNVYQEGAKYFGEPIRCDLEGC
jgi:hypothetical protein